MDELEQVDRYCDAVPRPMADVEEHGSLRLFLPRSGSHPWYARPSGPRPVSRSDLQGVLTRQRELGLPLAVEWVEARPGGLDVLCGLAALRVHRYPLLAALPAELRPPPEVAAEVRLLTPADDLGASAAVADLGFGHPGTAIGPVGLSDVAVARPGAQAVTQLAARVAQGRPVVAGAFVDEELVARGGHTLCERVSEVTGVAVLPAFRRRRLAAAVTAVLADDAVRRGARLVWLSADSAEVARIYQRLGFRHIGWSGAAVG